MNINLNNFNNNLIPNQAALIKVKIIIKGINLPLVNKFQK
jgi:hypothetical protein